MSEEIQTIPIALQLYTVREVLDQDVDQCLKRVADIGYENVELAGLHGRTPEQMKKALDAHGLRAVAAHEGLDRLNNDIQGVAHQAKTLGYDLIVCPFLPEPHRTAGGYQNVKRFLSELAGEVADQGLTVCYHNHAFEFDILDNGQRGIDILFDPAGSTAIKSELDVYWVRKGGDDPLEWLERLPGRTPLVHMKDMAGPGSAGGRGDGDFAEVGAGVIDLQAIVDAAPNNGVRCFVVEQDAGWRDGDPIQSAKISFENLSKMVR